LPTELNAQSELQIESDLIISLFAVLTGSAQLETAETVTNEDTYMHTSICLQLERVIDSISGIKRYVSYESIVTAPGPKYLIHDVYIVIDVSSTPNMIEQINPSYLLSVTALTRLSLS